MKQKKRMKEGLIPPDPSLTGENTSPLSQNNTDSNGSGDQLKADSPGPQWQWAWPGSQHNQIIPWDIKQTIRKRLIRICDNSISSKKSFHCMHPLSKLWQCDYSNRKWRGQKEQADAKEQKLRRLETIVRSHPGFGGGGGLSPINLRVSWSPGRQFPLSSLSLSSPSWALLGPRRKENTKLRVAGGIWRKTGNCSQSPVSRYNRHRHHHHRQIPHQPSAANLPPRCVGR